jgi:outer membrane biosynthesis protein TonB
MKLRKFTLLTAALLLFTFFTSCGKQADTTIHWVEEDIAAVNVEETDETSDSEKNEDNMAVSKTAPADAPDVSENKDVSADVENEEEPEKAYPTPSPSAEPDKPAKPSAEKPAPSAAPAKKSASSSQSLQAAGAKVYITKSGKKFHRPDCSSLSKSKIETLYEDASAKGYTPCANCKP